jgi:predicted CXXCH cytochrome family protein
MRTLITFSAALALALVLAPGAGDRGISAQAGGPDPEQYAWVDACKGCHEDIYKAWARTKHARTFDRLSAEERDTECVGCHVTGPKSKLELEGKIVNANVQCESCHGAAAAHAKDPSVKTGLVRKAGEKLCAECHSDRSPHFKGFFYGAMTGFVHRVTK